jgi:hypothetical protein
MDGITNNEAFSSSPRRNAIHWPFGDQAGENSRSGVFVNGTG